MPIKQHARSFALAGLLGFACTASWAIAEALPAGCQLAASTAAATGAGAASAPQAAFPPVQLEVRTPVAPVPVPREGRNYLIYELHLHNYAAEASSVRAIEVRSADGRSTASAQFKDAALQAVLAPDSGDEIDNSNRINHVRRIGAG